MSALSFEQQHYEFAEIWDPDWFPDEDRQRFRSLAGMVPPGTRSLLDVGCGNGMFLSAIRSEFGNQIERLAGVDRSEAALAHVSDEKRQANIDALPFGDREFDTVTCNEVIEHLPLNVYRAALAELARVAANTVVICVPYRENLVKNHSTCPCCVTRFSPDFHMRSFDESVLENLLDQFGFEQISTQHLGAQVLRYDWELRRKFRELFRKAPAPEFPVAAVCPVCGYTEAEKLEQALTARKRDSNTVVPSRQDVSEPTGLRAKLAAKMPTRTHYRWIAATYRRRESSSAR